MAADEAEKRADGKVAPAQGPAAGAAFAVGGDMVSLVIDVQGAVIRLSALGQSVVLDGVNESIELRTGQGSVISVSNEATTLRDGFGNEVKLDLNGLSLTSRGAITLSAAGPLTLSGLSVDVTAETLLKLKASAGAELESAGQTSVRGAMVAIN